MIWAFFGQNIFFDFLGFLGVQTRLLGLWLIQLFLGKFFFRRPKVLKTALNLSNELTRVHRPQKIGWNWILKESRKFDFLTHLESALWKVGKSEGPKISNFQKYRGTVRESSYKNYLFFTGLWHIYSMSKRENPITVGWAMEKMVFLAVWAIYGFGLVIEEYGPKPDFLREIIPKTRSGWFFL